MISDSRNDDVEAEELHWIVHIQDSREWVDVVVLRVIDRFRDARVNGPSRAL